MILDWVESLPRDWEPSRLRDLAQVQNSNVDKKVHEHEIPVRLCNYTDVYYNETITDSPDLKAATVTRAELMKFGLKAGDVIFTKDSESWDDIAIPAVVEADLPGVVCGYHLTMLRPHGDKVIGRFLFRSLQASGIREQLWTGATGVTRFGLGQDTIKNVVVARPPLQTQTAIADFLDRKTAAIDALIEKKERMIELLAEKRAALVHRAVTKGLDPDAPTKDSGIPTLGDVPSHWEVVRNKVVMREINVPSPAGDEELLTVSHITGVTRRSEKEVTMFMAEDHSGYKCVEPGDLIINTMWAWMGALGVALIPGIVSPAYGTYRLDQQRLAPAFYDYFYRTRPYVVEMTRYSKGVWSSRLRLYPEQFLGLLTVVPPKPEQEAIVKFIEKNVERLGVVENKLRAAVDRLKEYRQALITQAVTGQLDIPDAA